MCDISSCHFTLSEMAPVCASTSKPLDALNDLRNRRSLRLLEDCVKKLGKVSGQTLGSGNSPGADVCSKIIPCKFETFGNHAPNWLTELQNCMSKYMQAHSCAGPKSCEAKHGEPLFMKNGSKAQK